MEFTTDLPPTAYFTGVSRPLKTGVADANAFGDPELFYYDPEFKQHCQSRLSELASLKPGWDKDGAPAIDPDILNAARRFVDALPDHVATRPLVVPLTSGNVQLEWHHRRCALELEFESPTTIHYLKWDPDNGVEDESVFDRQDQEKALELIRWFMKGFFDG